MAEMLVLAKSSHTYNGVTRKFVLEVDTEEIVKAPKLDPAVLDAESNQVSNIRLPGEIRKRTTRNLISITKLLSKFGLQRLVALHGRYRGKSKHPSGSFI